ncbi:DUF1294 domain-containing protein [Marinobacter sp. V034]|uniref:DUF1294 domain-containing protein n=1 Tax=Marinobacter sp. V034 TaxID=3459610 RepID=UPI004043E2CA
MGDCLHFSAPQIRRWQAGMRVKGTLVQWHGEKGFGFAAPVSGSDKIFVHVTDFENRSRRQPHKGMSISYVAGRDKHGRPCATAVQINGDRSPARPSRRPASLALPAAAMWAIVVAGAWLEGKLPLIIPLFYLAASVVTFCVYAWDKRAARRDAWRIQENTLHILALIGGWPGAALAHQLLRHKSSKRAFRNVFWLTVIVNCAGLIWLLLPDGAAWMNLVIAKAHLDFDLPVILFRLQELWSQLMGLLAGVVR